MIHIPRQEALLVTGILLLFGAIIILGRLYRSRKHGISLRMQIFLALAITTLILTLTFTAIIVDRLKARASLFAHKAAIEDAQMVALLATRIIESMNISLDAMVQFLKPGKSFYQITTRDTDTRIQLIDKAGKIILDTAPAPRKSTAAHTPPEVRMALEGKIDTIARQVRKHRVGAAIPIIIEGEVKGVVRVVKPTVNMRQILADTAPKVMLLGLILAGSAALCGIFMGHFVGAPLERLTRAAHRIAKGERQSTLPVPTGREVKKLTEAFESMRRELQEKSDVETLTSDLSHELKNPVASIKASAEVIADSIHSDPETATHFVKRILESTSRLESLTHDMLTLARLEAKGITDSKARVNLKTIAISAMEHLSDHAETKNIAFDLTSHALFVHGNEDWIKRALENLMLNALTFSPENTPIQIDITESPPYARISVGDKGPGISKTLKHRIFERFITSRSSEKGTGLGLAIVRSVAEAHGGYAEILSTNANGTHMAFYITLK